MNILGAGTFFSESRSSLNFCFGLNTHLDSVRSKWKSLLSAKNANKQEYYPADFLLYGFQNFKNSESLHLLQLPGTPTLCHYLVGVPVEASQRNKYA